MSALVSSLRWCVGVCVNHWDGLFGVVYFRWVWWGLGFADRGMEFVSSLGFRVCL